MGADLPPGRYIGHALQRGAACRCDQVRDSRHWTAVLAAIRRCMHGACPGQGAVLAGWRPPRQPLDTRACRLVAGRPRPDYPAWTWRAAARGPS